MKLFMKFKFEQKINYKFKKQIKMKNIFYLALVLIVFGCNSSAQTNNSISDTSVVVKKDSIIEFTDTHIKIDTTIKSVFEKDYNSLINSKLKRWIKFYKKECSSFNINEFSFCSTYFLNPYYVDYLEETKMKNFIELYKPYLIWNSDSSKAIDLYSVGVWLGYDTLGNKYAEFDVDSHVDLIDFKNKKLIVLMQTGTFSSFDDGFWIDNDNVLVTEIGKDLENEVIDDEFIIKYHVINLNTYQTSSYCSPKSYKPNSSYLYNIFKELLKY